MRQMHGGKRDSCTVELYQGSMNDFLTINNSTLLIPNNIPQLIPNNTKRELVEQVVEEGPPVRDKLDAVDVC